MSPRQLRDELLELAANYRWTWARPVEGLLRSLPGAAVDVHPIETVRRLTPAQLTELSANETLITRVRAVLGDLEALSPAGKPEIAYYSSEFGLSQAMHQYAGGLGILAGDHLKAASDASMPLVGVGLFYHRGSFRQQIWEGRQIERLDPVDPANIAAKDTGVVVEIPFPGRDVVARVLQIAIGRVALILLDTNLDSNSPQDREITDSLYLGSPEKRLAQEMVLGVGGARAVEAMGWEVRVHHLNEGHAGFVALHLIDRALADGDLGSAIDSVRERIVFTTHTPVPAGITRLERETLLPYLELWAERWDADVERVWDLGEDPDDRARFNMAASCLRISRVANGVSELHGEVSRQLFARLPEGTAIGHVTNGVHARTWTSTSMQALFDETLGPGWDLGASSAWSLVDQIEEGQLLDERAASSRRLSERLGSLGHLVDPDSLIVGWARRFAPYKRPTLILRDRDRLLDLIADDARPIHFVFAGKPHPANAEGHRLLSDVLDFASSPEARGRFSFVADYGMEIASHLVAGCDVWLNNPMRLHEASGTSGEKAALNGVLNISVLDGWWAEMFDGDNGWAIASSESDDPSDRDDHDARSVLDAITSARTEYFDDRVGFNARIRHAWRTLGPQVTAARMLEDYDHRIYNP